MKSTRCELAPARGYLDDYRLVKKLSCFIFMIAEGNQCKVIKRELLWFLLSERTLHPFFFSNEKFVDEGGKIPGMTNTSDYIIYLLLRVSCL